MNIIQSIIPAGYDEWAKKAAEKLEKYPEAFQPGGNLVRREANGQGFLSVEEKDPADEEWTASEGTRTREEKRAEFALLRKGRRKDYSEIVKWEPEPPLDASQYVLTS